MARWPLYLHVNKKSDDDDDEYGTLHGYTEVNNNPFR